MTYTIKRGLQEFGPYSLAELQRYVASGNVLMNDLCKSEGMADWMPVSQVIGSIPVPQAAPAAVSVPSVSYPDPPGMAWSLLFLLEVITCGLFGWVWVFVQAAWAKKIDPESKATTLYTIGIVCLVLNVATIFTGQKEIQAVGNIFNLGGAVLFLIAAFNIRASMENHYNSVERLGLKLTGVMTFFFNTIYLQYKMNEVVKLKAAAGGVRR